MKKKEKRTAVMEKPSDARQKQKELLRKEPEQEPPEKNKGEKILSPDPGKSARGEALPVQQEEPLAREYQEEYQRRLQERRRADLSAAYAKNVRSPVSEEPLSAKPADSGFSLPDAAGAPVQAEFQDQHQNPADKARDSAAAAAKQAADRGTESL